MPVFTAIGGYVATSIIGLTAGTLTATVVSSLVAAAAAAVTAEALGLNDQPSFPESVDQGVDVRLGARTTNKIPVLYGNFMTRGIITYAEVTSDKQTLHTVITLGEEVDSIDDFYWSEYKLTLDSNGAVTAAVADDGETTDRLNDGRVLINAYPSGGRSTYLEGVSDTWDNTFTMTGLAYIVVSIQYSREHNLNGVGDIRILGQGLQDNPARSVEDMLTNSIYGLGLDASNLDATSITAAANYCDEMVAYIDIDGVEQMERRFTTNGVLGTDGEVLDRIDLLLRGCGGTLRWSQGKWGIFINKQDTASAYIFTNDNVLGNVTVTESGLNNLFNKLEMNFGRRIENNWQRGTTYLESPESVRYANELDKLQVIDLPLTRSNTEAERLGTVLLNQARQQLSVQHTADVTALPLEAGDIVSYTLPEFSWDAKLFRIVEKIEREVDGGIEYDITAVEYADAVYIVGELNETDVSPNTPAVDIRAISPVDDLVVAGAFPTTATPYIELQWTVPDNSLVDRFSIFYNLVNQTFNSGNTKIGGVEQLPDGVYSAGDLVTHQLVGVPAGDVSIWVVAANNVVSSSESNRAFVNNWRPRVIEDANFEMITRYNQTPSVIAGVDIDVGQPPANATGIGVGRNNNVNDTGWYAFDPEATDRENAPVWTATTETQRSDAEPRVIDFDFSGTSATQTTTFTPENQETDFTFTGTVGERQFFYNARPEITDFTLSGQAADFDAGVAAQWGIKATGDTESTGPDTNDVFYILPAGTSDTFTGESFTFTPSGNTGDGSDSEITDAAASSLVAYSSNPGFRTRNGGTFIPMLTSSSIISDLVLDGSIYNSIITFFSIGSSYTSLPSGTIINIENADGAIFRWTDNDIQIRNFGTGLQLRRVNDAAFSSFTVTPAPGNSAITFSDTNFQIDFNSEVEAISSSVSITLDSDTNSYTLANNLSGGVSIGTALNTAIGTDFSGFVKTFDASTGAITFTADDSDDHTSSVVVVAGTNGTLVVAPSSIDAVGTETTIQLEITSENIDETISLGSNLTGSALRTDVFNKFSVLTSITAEFTVELVTVSIDGTDTEVVRFTANDLIDHIFMVTVNSGITETTSGTINDGQEAGTATTVRITYDSSITPSFQDITFGPGDDINAASELVTLIDGHGGLNASHVNYEVGTNSGPTQGSFAASGSFTSSFMNFGPQSGTLGNINYGASYSEQSAAGAKNSEISAFTSGTTVTLSSNASLFSIGDYFIATFRSRTPSAGGGSRPFTGSRTFYLAQVTNVVGSVISYELVDQSEFPYYQLEVSIPVTGNGSNSIFDKQFLRVGPNINDAYNADELIDVVENNVEGNGVLITNGADGPVDSPIVTITEQGTGDAAFQVIDERAGVATSGTGTSYTINYAGSNITGGIFTAASTSSSMASQITSAINVTTQLTATNSSNVVTATSVANSASNTLVTITAGTNKPGGVSTNNAASVGAVTQVGSAIDAFGGVDSTVTVFNGGVSYYSNTYDGNTIPEIVSDLVDGINVDNPAFSNFFTAAIKAGDADEIVATSDFTGTTPILTMSTIPGFIGSVDAIGNITQVAATLGVVRTEVSDGQSDPVISGTLSTYSVTQGSTEVIAATDIPSGTPFGTLVTLIASDIIDNSDDIEYTTAIDGGKLTTTSTFNNTTPDLTITLVGGTNADSTLPDIQVVKTVIQVGDLGSIDLTDAEWTYAVTAPTTDGDTTMIGPDGTIEVRRGLVLDTTELQETSLSYDVADVVSSTTHTTGNKLSTIVTTGLVAMPSISTSDASNVGYLIEYATGDDPIATDIEFIGQFYGESVNGEAGLVIDNSIVVGNLASTYTLDTEGDDYIICTLNSEALSYVVSYLNLTSDADFQDLETSVNITIQHDASNIIVTTGITRILYDGTNVVRFGGTSTTPATAAAMGSISVVENISVSIARTDASTWTELDTLSFNTQFPTAFAGQLVPVPLGVSATFDAAADTKYTFRMTRTGNNLIGGFSWNMLLIEELRAT